MRGRIRRPAPLSAHPGDPSLMVVPLTQGRSAIISTEDAEEVGRFKWHFHKDGYAHTKRMGHAVKLHRLIGERAGILSGETVDHINGDRLDCRRSNLRAASFAENAQNGRLYNTNTSGVKGVYWKASKRRWTGAVIAIGKSHFCGLHHTIEAAAAAVRETRERLHGAFARHE